MGCLVLNVSQNQTHSALLLHNMLSYAIHTYTHCLKLNLSLVLQNVLHYALLSYI